MDSNSPDGTPDTGDPGVRGKRGRKTQLPNPDDGPVAGFAHDLCLLKRAASDPSYDRMRAELGAAASKSALSAAARGKTLPSWETTWEFVRCLAVAKLGQDEQAVRAEWRAKWDQAASSGVIPEPPKEHTAEGTSADATAADEVDAEPAVGSTGTADSPNRENPVQEGPTAESAVLGSTAQAAMSAAGSNRRPSARLRAGIAAIAVAVLGVSAVLVGLMFTDRPSAPFNPARSTATTAPQYPVPGDDSMFGSNGRNGDVTVPDGTRFSVGDEFEKTWRLTNIGTVPWKGRFLRAYGDTSHICVSPDRVPIPYTAPGEPVDVSVPVTAARPGYCKVEWKMVDSNGQLFFPVSKRGVRYEVFIQE